VIQILFLSPKLNVSVMLVDAWHACQAALPASALPDPIMAHRPQATAQHFQKIRNPSPALSPCNPYQNEWFCELFLARRRRLII
jgi:hypothetical protein